MQAKKYPATQGWKWMVQSFALFKKSPAQITSSSIALVFIYSLALSIPLLPSLLMPMMWAGVYRAYYAVDRDLPISRALVFSGFNTAPRTLLLQGAFTMIFTLIAVSAALLLIDDGSLLKMGEAIKAFSDLSPEDQAKAAPPELLLSTRGQFAVLACIAMCLLAGLCTYFAPQLIGVKKLSLVKALIFSFIACWRNLGALFVFFGAFIGISLVAVSVLSVLLGPYVLAVFLPLYLLIMALGCYVATRDIFGDLTDAADHRNYV